MLVHGANFHSGIGLVCIWAKSVKTTAVWISTTQVECKAPPLAAEGKVSLHVSNNGEQVVGEGVTVDYLAYPTVGIVSEPVCYPGTNDAIVISVSPVSLLSAITCRFTAPTDIADTWGSSNLAKGTVACPCPDWAVAEGLEVSVAVSFDSGGNFNAVEGEIQVYHIRDLQIWSFLHVRWICKSKRSEGRCEAALRSGPAKRSRGS